MSGAKKQYGLILSSRKKASAPVAKSSVFGDSSSDEDDTGRGHVNTSLRRENEKRSRQMREDMERAMEEDPSVFEYDALYDNMVAERQKANPRMKQKDKKPRYIASLKRIAERRKIEQDIIYERKAQRELEAEGEQFADKDTFLTSGYREKLKEREALEQELAKEEEREKANDVKNQEDLSMFYRHMLDRRADGSSSEKPPPPPLASMSAQNSPPPPPDRPVSPHTPPLKATAEQRTEEQNAAGENERERLASEEEKVELPLERAASHGMEEEDEEEEGEGVSKRTRLLDLSEEAIAAAKEERKRKAFAKRTDNEALGSAKERYLARKKARLASKQTQVHS